MDALGRGAEKADGRETLLSALLYDPQYKAVADDLRAVAHNFRDVSERVAQGQGLLGQLTRDGARRHRGRARRRHRRLPRRDGQPARGHRPAQGGRGDDGRRCSRTRRSTRTWCSSSRARGGASCCARSSAPRSTRAARSSPQGRGAADGARPHDLPLPGVRARGAQARYLPRLRPSGRPTCSWWRSGSRPRAAPRARPSLAATRPQPIGEIRVEARRPADVERHGGAGPRAGRRRGHGLARADRRRSRHRQVAPCCSR